MSEETHEAHSHVVIPEPVRDIYLMSILAMLDEDESNTSALSVTLQVGGAIVCGELIGHSRWQSELKAWLATVGGSSDVISNLVEIVHEELSENGPNRPTHLHLRDAKFITNYAGGIEGFTPQGPSRPLWRARIADVQGWSLGRPQ